MLGLRAPSQTLTPWPLQEAMVNLGELGQDLEHCLQLRKRLRELPGVWAEVWGRREEGETQSTCPHGGTELLRIVRQHGSGEGSSHCPRLTTCMCLGSPLISPSRSSYVFKMGIMLAS